MAHPLTSSSLRVDQLEAVALAGGFYARSLLAWGCEAFAFQRADGDARTMPTARRTEEGRPVVAEGSPAPDFTLRSDEGDDITLSGLRGRPVVYFYPKDDTPGCTKQACGFRDAYGEFEERGATILGVSRDSEAPRPLQGEVRAALPALLADPEHEVAEQYGVWVEKNTYGKKSMGSSARRSSSTLRGTSPERCTA